jgi:hypothetical protein
MIVDGEKTTGNFADFDKIQVEKQDDKWKITVQAPEAKEVSGLLDGETWTLSWQAPAGYFVSIGSQDSPKGFSLTKGKKAGS